MTDLNVTAQQEKLTPEQIKAELAIWFKRKADLAKLKYEESEQRKKLFGQIFPDAVEGTNTFDLQDGFEVKGQRVISRDVDTATLDSMKQLANISLEEPDSEMGMSPEDFAVWKTITLDELIRYKPELRVSEYRKLNEAQRHLVEQFLIIKDGSPQMEIKPASTRRAKRK